jgi:peptidoglycan hydrolase CwlO-like protein
VKIRRIKRYDVSVLDESHSEQLRRESKQLLETAAKLIEHAATLKAQAAELQKQVARLERRIKQKKASHGSSVLRSSHADLPK